MTPLDMGAPRVQERPRPPRPPLVLRVAIPRDTPTDVRDIFDEAARRVEGLAHVRYALVERLPDGVPFQVQLPGDGTRPPRGRRARAVIGFVDALADALREAIPSGDSNVMEISVEDVLRSGVADRPTRGLRCMP